MYDKHECNNNRCGVDCDVEGCGCDDKVVRTVYLPVYLKNLDISHWYKYLEAMEKNIEFQKWLYVNKHGCCKLDWSDIDKGGE